MLSLSLKSLQIIFQRRKKKAISFPIWIKFTPEYVLAAAMLHGKDGVQRDYAGDKQRTGTEWLNKVNYSLEKGK